MGWGESQGFEEGRRQLAACRLQSTVNSQQLRAYSLRLAARSWEFYAEVAEYAEGAEIGTEKRENPKGRLRGELAP
jgi:hypothetical protein